MIEEEIYKLLPALMRPYAATTFDRAFPYYKDGFNVSARRVLYVMFEGRYFDVTKKSAKIVGATIGDYHPHGDSSVYSVLVKMGTNFNKNYPLVTPQGNFGNMNGDGAAAMRYTEAKLSKFAQDVIENPVQNVQAIDWQDNYANELKEPIYLSTKLPLVLINGFTGIGTGYRCSIPSHTLKDVVMMIKRFRNNKNISLEELVDGVYPEFPTGGVITNREEIESIYKGMKPSGSVKMKADIEIDRANQSILIHSMPYGMMWGDVVRTIKSLVTDKKNVILSGIKTPAEKKKIVDGESGFLEYELICNKDANLVEIANELQNKVLRSSYAIELMLNYGRSVRSVNMKDIIAEWYNSRCVSLNRKYEHILTKLRKEQHIYEGILKIYDHLDEIIDLFKTINELDEVTRILMKRYDLTEIQSKYIAERQLRQISQKSKMDLIDRIKSIENQINENLMMRARIEDIIVEDAETILSKYDRDRRSLILDESESDTGIEIMSGAILVSRSQISLFTINDITNGRIILNGLKSSKVNGKNVKEIIRAHEIESNLAGVVVFTRGNTARYYSVKEIGIVNNWKTLDVMDELIDALPVYNYDEDQIVIFSSDNKIKVINVNELKNKYVPVTAGDDILCVTNIDIMKSECLIVSEKGEYLLFPVESVPVVGRTASGVKTGFDVSDGTSFTMMQIDSGVNQLLVSSVNENGDGYITPVNLASLSSGNRTNKPKRICKNHSSVIGVFQIDNRLKKSKCVLIGKTSTVQILTHNFKQIDVAKPVGHNVLEVVQVKSIE